MGRTLLLAVVGTLLWCCSPDVPNNLDASIDSGGGDGGVDPNDGARSGSRLKLTWYVFTDGTRQWSGMYDSERKEYCSPYYSAWTDGNVYCTPEHGGSLVYTNATCTTRAMQVYVDSLCPQPPPKYLLDYVYGACSSQPAHLYQRGAKIAVSTYYYKNSNGTCGAANTAQSYDAFYALPAEIATTDLVQLTLGAPQGTGRLGVRSYESYDGMRFPWLLHDSAIDADCSPSYYSDTATTATCAPYNARYAAYNHDAACVQPELAIDKTCTVPQYAYTFPDTSCPYDQETYFAVSSQLASSPLYYSSGTTCTATTPSASNNYYALGQQLNAMPLARGADTDPTHRIKLVHFTDQDGLRFRDPYAVYDGQKATNCYPETLPDGTIRCIAYGGYVDTYYTSSSCATPVDVVEVYSGPASCMAPTVPKYARKYVSPAPGTCTYSTEVHAITTAHTSPVYTGVPGSCSVYTPFEAKLYNVGPIVPVTDFVGATIVADP